MSDESLEEKLRFKGVATTGFLNLRMSIVYVIDAQHDDNSVFSRNYYNYVIIIVL